MVRSNVFVPGNVCLLEPPDECLDDEGVAGAGEGVHGHAPAPELHALVVQLATLRVQRSLEREWSFEFPLVRGHGK